MRKQIEPSFEEYWYDSKIFDDQMKRRGFFKSKSFMIARFITKAAGGTIREIKKTAAGLFVETVKDIRSSWLLKAKKIEVLNIEVTPQHTLNFSKGVVLSKDLLNCTEEEVVDELNEQLLVHEQGVGLFYKPKCREKEMASCLAESLVLTVLISFGVDITSAVGIIRRNIDTEWTGFLGKFPVQFVDGFYKLPFSIKEAEESNPPFIDTKESHPRFNVKLFCFDNDPRICPFFDVNGKVAGLRMSHLKSEVAKNDNLLEFPYKYDEVPVYNSGIFLGKDVWYIEILFTNPENLLANGTGKITTNLVADGLWVKFGENWEEIPKDECAIRKKGWVKQGFVPWMGIHYSLTRNDDCTKYIPYLPFYTQGKLIGISVAPFGRFDVEDREWFEDPPVLITKAIVPNGSETCVLDWSVKYRIASFHTYFIQNPRKILTNRSPKCEEP
ncbi:uncharacterized protein LOC142321181 [Lycorma delicatula]|uniref:uncharacterized protein LOC142321181 n=1 Tax=Lycorma delicatula TaxID=130591 RepID=UPI003F50FD9A